MCPLSRWSDPSRGQHPLDRTRAMPHIKTFMRHTHSGDSIAWILVGSHNLSKAAWGEIQHRKTDSPSLQIESFELSVLLHPANLDQSAEPPFTLSRSRASSQPTTHEQVNVNPFLFSLLRTEELVRPKTCFCHFSVSSPTPGSLESYSFEHSCAFRL